ncbi:Wzz/FepE/Etk N-terminal domain-containing protein, partial [Escherichia coli]
MTSVMNNKPSPVDSDDIDLGRLIGELIDHRKLIVAITTGFTVIAVFYALLATPIYQANALVQVEQKQGNTILSNLSQILPDSQPQSAPEITLLQSRMILGKTVDDLGLQTQIKQKFFPVIGRGLARIMGNKLGAIEVKDLYLPDNKSGENPEVILTVIDKDNYSIEADGLDFNAKVGELVEKNGMSILVTAIEAEPGSKFSINYLTRLKAMNMLQNSFGVADQGKDTGMLTLTMTGDNPQQITKILDSISQNYLAQNVERQAAQDAKSLDFLNEQLPKVRNDLDQAEDKLNAYRKQRDSVD